MNMSYCRFENTSRDVEDCINAIELNEHLDLSQSEISGFVDLIELARTLVEQFEDYPHPEDVREHIKSIQE
jgi:hypothetical protein